MWTAEGSFKNREKADVIYGRSFRDFVKVLFVSLFKFNLKKPIYAFNPLNI